MQVSSQLKIALLACAFGLAVASAQAQDYGAYGPPSGNQYGPPPSGQYGPPPGYQNGPPPGYQNGPPEQVQVYAPHFREERTPLNAPLDKVSLSVAVPYNDLDLRTQDGARELRSRVRDAAANVCAQLADAYPVQPAYGTSCIKTAYEDGIVRAKSAIDAARVDWRVASPY